MIALLLRMGFIPLLLQSTSKGRGFPMSEATTGMVVRDIPMDEIFADTEFNCRGAISPIDVIDLSRDIQENGLQNPILVQPYSSPEHPGKKYRIVSGYRRHKAAIVMEWKTIPCNVREGLTDIQARVLNLSENVNRKDLNILEEAKAINNLIIAGMTQEEIGKAVHQSRGWAQVRIYLLTLPTEIQAEAAAGLLTYNQIRELYTMSSNADRYEAVKKIKDAKERGEKTPKLRKPNTNTLVKKKRERAEIFAMMDHIQTYVGNNFGTRCLAWAAGEISDNDVFRDVKELADEEGVNYEIPREALSPVS